MLKYNAQIVSNSTALQSPVEDGDFYCDFYFIYSILLKGLTLVFKRACSAKRCHELQMSIWPLSALGQIKHTVLFA